MASEGSQRIKRAIIPHLSLYTSQGRRKIWRRRIMTTERDTMQIPGKIKEKFEVK